MLTFLTLFFLKIDQVLALGPAPPHWWPELEFRDRFGADGVQLFWCTFSKKKLNGSRRGRRIEQRCAISAAWRRERDAGTVYFENAFANEEQPAIYMHDDRIGLVVCPMFALRPDHRVERARLRAAGAYAFS